MAKFNGLVENIEDNRNKATQITENSTDEQYPSAKAVKDYIDNNDNGFIKSDGSVSMSDDLNMSGNAINGCKAIVITQAPSAPGSGSIDRFVGNVGFNDTRYLKQTDKVTNISSSSTDTQIPSAKAVKDYVDEHGGGTTETAYEIVASESGTSESSTEITINLSKPCKEVQIAINVPPPTSANLSYCSIAIYTVGDKSFATFARELIQTTHTKTALVLGEYKAGLNGIDFSIGAIANVGRTFNNINAEANVNMSNGVMGYCGRTWNLANASDYYIDRIVLRPTNNSSAFEAGTNYIVWGR